MPANLFEENTKAPQETKISLSKTHIFFRFFWNIFYVCLFSFFFVITTNVGKIFAACFLAFIGYNIFTEIKELKKEPKIQLRLSDKGIYIGTNFIPWQSVNKYEFINKQLNSQKIFEDEYLILYTKNGKKEVFVNQLNISTQKLNYLLKIYKNRNTAILKK